jgi:hypothetical protein
VSSVSGLPITADPVASLEERLLPIVGASRRLDCKGGWVMNRDAADLRLVDEYRAGGMPLIGEPRRRVARPR